MLSSLSAKIDLDFNIEFVVESAFEFNIEFDAILHCGVLRVCNLMSNHVLHFAELLFKLDWSADDDQAALGNSDQSQLGRQPIGQRLGNPWTKHGQA